jgi:selenocysteine-specific elongation factor
MRSIIVGTAGHIDHGKTTLVRALTGVDADRLPEEKRRGITIDLGFAELDLGDVRVGFVDVPGHERFVKNMLAGAHGLDLVALVIAADEGVMPQTREHFDICRLLGVTAGLIVLTKRDAADAELLELVRMEAEELARGSFLEGAPVLAVSGRTGEGVEELKAALRDIARRLPERTSEMAARLPVDRAFAVRGFGAVVTGTLVAGEIAEGQEMELLPSGARVRVRGVQVHGAAVPAARAGQRTAVNLGGVEAAAIERGMVLAPAGRLRPTQIVDAFIDVLDSAPRPLRSRQRVRVHLGTAEVLARVAVLEEAGEIAPGACSFAQLRLESPVAAVPGERFIIRSYSPQQTIAGGRIVDAHAAKRRGRERAEARARLALMVDAADDARLAAFAESAGARGLKRAEAAARTGWSDETLDGALKVALASGAIIDAEGVLAGRETLARLTEAMLEEVEGFHRREPMGRGLARETLREKIFAHAAPELFRAALARAEVDGALVSERDVVRSAKHSLALSAEDESLRARLEQIFHGAGLEPPSLEEALAEAGAKRREHAMKILQLLVDAGRLARVREDMFFHREHTERLAAALREHAAGLGPERLIDMPAFKSLSGVSRKYGIPLLEYFDRAGVTRRAGDRRIIL